MQKTFRNLSSIVKGLPAMLLSLCVVAALTMVSMPASAQTATGTAKGEVVDSQGEPMMGASVVVLGTTLGASTDLDGKFSIAGVKNGATLRVSFVGCKTVEVKWEGQPLNITLEDDAQTLDEVVVVGFGTQKRANLTGAVSTVTSKDLVNRPINSVTEALQGVVPGLNVLSSSQGGLLSGTQSMNIRGTGTIGSGASVVPLVIIDGMEGDINTVNPADVENVTILKDAAASSIYGSRAAGGVILVTTRSGSEGNVSVTYSDSFRWSAAMRMPHKMNSYNFALYSNQAKINSGAGAQWSDEKIAEIKAYMENPTGKNMFRDPGTGNWATWQTNELAPLANDDQLDIIFGGYHFSQEHNVAISGGNQRVNYYFSGNLLSRDGLLNYGDDNSQRYTVTGRVNIKLADWINFGYTTRWYRNKYDAPSIIGEYGSNQLYHDYMRYWQTEPMIDPNGHYTPEGNIEALINGGRFIQTKDRLDQQFVFNLNPISGLNVHAEFNYRTTNQNEHEYYLQQYWYTPENEAYIANSAAYQAIIGNRSAVIRYNQKSNYFNPNIYADYSFNIAEKNNIKVMAGYQSEWYKYTSFSARKNDIANSSLPMLSLSSGDATVSDATGAWTTQGVFGRINYDYDNRYLVELNMRYDGTSRFRKGSRWTVSPSFSLGWNIANESFWEEIKGKVHTLKLRGSWGRLGNQNTSSYYPTYATMGYSSSYGWIINDRLSPVGNVSGLISETLTWEKNQTWDIGLDWGLLNNRLTGSFDYYQRKTFDMVGPGPALPDVLGADVPNINSITMLTKGWELQVSWRDRINDFSYGVSANLFDYTQEVTDYPMNPNKLYSQYYNGRKLGEIWGFTTVGLAKTDEEMNAHLSKVNQDNLGSNWRAGDIMYADLNGDGKIDTGDGYIGSKKGTGDLSIIGNSTPRYQFGLNLDAQWKGFDLKLFFQGVGKRDYWASGPVMFGFSAANIWQGVALEPHLDYFRNDPNDPLGLNLDSYYPRPNYGGGKNTNTQTRYLQNAAYLRLKNVTLGYTIPKSITRKVYLDNVRFYVSGENVATITNFTKTGDPEMINSYGYSYGYGKVYPLQHTWSCGVNVTF